MNFENSFIYVLTLSNYAGNIFNPLSLLVFKNSWYFVIGSRTIEQAPKSAIISLDTSADHYTAMHSNVEGRIQALRGYGDQIIAEGKHETFH